MAMVRFERKVKISCGQRATCGRCCSMVILPISAILPFSVKERLVVDVALWLLHFSIFGVLQLFLVKERLVVDVALWSLLYGLYGLQG
jgi:hypothetical protein